MKYVNAKICVLIAVFGLFMSFSSCTKTKDPGPGVVSFSVANATYGEDQGAINIEVKISAKQSADVTIAYTFTGSSDTYNDGDYYIVSDNPITIPAGQTTAHIQIMAIDDTQIDADDALTLQLTTITGHAKLSTTATQTAFNLSITNNDQTPSNALQIDLTWDQGLNSDIDAVDLDLWLQQGVVINGTTGNIDDPGTHYTSSESGTGFESIVVAAGDTDQEYFIGVPYFSGSGAVNFTLTFNGFGETDDASTGLSFTADQAPLSAGNYLFKLFGPFEKSGSTFANGRSISGKPGMPKMKVYQVTVKKLQKSK